MRFYKTLFFEIPSKDFIMPVYTEEDVATLKSFLAEDEVQFSVGYKSMEDKRGYYYIGRVKAFTDLFRLSDFPVIYRKRVLDVLNGFQKEANPILFDVRECVLKKLVYFKMTPYGPKSFLENYTEENVQKLEKLDIVDYYVKEFEACVVSSFEGKSSYSKEEVFYKVKNPNY